MKCVLGVYVDSKDLDKSTHPHRLNRDYKDLQAFKQALLFLLFLLFPTFLCSDFSLFFSENALLSLLFSPKIFEVTKNCNFFPHSVSENQINLNLSSCDAKVFKIFLLQF